ncbi:NAD-dependent epimerase/dehydratase family protein [Flavobacteriaceae bacterium]|nr:NAD-dependent epimerase/dehydratase family protein [Flavobacteriaceae bacterium]
MGQTILITGATGLVGKALVKHCLAEGHTVHYLTTRKSKIISQKTIKASIGIRNKTRLTKPVLKGLR